MSHPLHTRKVQVPLPITLAHHEGSLHAPLPPTVLTFLPPLHTRKVQAPLPPTPAHQEGTVHGVLATLSYTRRGYRRPCHPRLYIRIVQGAPATHGILQASLPPTTAHQEDTGALATRPCTPERYRAPFPSMVQAPFPPMVQAPSPHKPALLLMYLFIYLSINTHL